MRSAAIGGSGILCWVGHGSLDHENRGEISVPDFANCVGIVNNIPDVDESFTLIVVDRRDPDLPKDDRPVCGRRAGDEDEVFAKAEVR
jgi:hypothetical protein